MANSPSEILKKTKSKGNNVDKDDKANDDKEPRRNGMLDFIAKNKKVASK